VQSWPKGLWAFSGKAQPPPAMYPPVRLLQRRTDEETRTTFKIGLDVEAFPGPGAAPGDAARGQTMWTLRVSAVEQAASFRGHSYGTGAVRLADSAAFLLRALTYALGRICGGEWSITGDPRRSALRRDCEITKRT
jgi:hypothetical protein